MEELIELLEEIQPDADFENCDTLIDDGIPLFFGIAMVFYFSEFKRSVCTPSRTMRSPSPSVQK